MSSDLRPFRLDVLDVPDPGELALLEDRVAEAAIAGLGAAQEREFAIFVRDDRGAVIAGVAGIVFGGYCELPTLWVDESLRGRGLGSELMAAAEMQARRRGCAVIMFHAYDTLVRGFHEKLGYRTVG